MADINPMLAYLPPDDSFLPQGGPDRRRRAVNAMVAAQYDGQAPTYSYDFQGAPLSPAVEAFKAQRGQPGVIQKTLGLVPGLDAEGRRGAQSWTNALMSTAQFPIDMIEGAGQAITAPMRAYRGEFDPMTEQGIGEALNVAGTAMTGGLAAPKPNNTVGIFGGRLAKTADHGALRRAETMEKDGFSRNDIRTETGWFKDPGGNWRFEIDDSKAAYTPGTGTLGSVLQHDALYEAYPQLRNIPVGGNVNPLANGQYLPKRNGAISNVLERFTGPSARIDMSPSAGKSSILHETQHAVDDIEGALRFADPRNPYGTSGPVTDRSAAYQDAPFEQSARGTQARADLTPAEREARAPWMDYSGKPALRRDALLSKEPLPPISQEGGMPVLPERTALEDAYRNIGLDPNDRYIRAAIEQFKGPRLKDPSITDMLVDSALGRDGLNSATSRDPNWQNLARSVEAYREKAQQIGHNGGPAPSTWEDPFLYTFAGRSGAGERPRMVSDYFADANTSGPMQILGYRGKIKPTDTITSKPWASDNPQVASSYTIDHYDNPGAGIADGSNISPLRFDFQNPLIVDAKGNRYSNVPIPGFEPNKLYPTGSVGTEEIARMAGSRGYDGLVIKNVRDSAEGGDVASNVIHALRPGTTYSALTGDLLYANGGRPGGIAGAAISSLDNNVPGIRAYHGSPHDFDRFDLSKIGTGEGAQAYGHGLYFAENEGVAKSYRDALGGQRFADGAKFDDASPAHQASAYVAGTKSKEEAIAAINQDIAMSRRQMDEKHAQILLRARGLLESESPIPKLDQGKMYEVNIKADPNDFLDWDKPLSQQSEHIRKSMTDLANGEILPDWNGMQAYRSVGSQMMSNLDLMSPELAQRVRDAGIPGVKYLDQGSRTGVGEGTRNYVVFDDKLIEILRKYGLLGMAGGAAVNEMLSGAQEQRRAPWSNAMLPGDA